MLLGILFLHMWKKETDPHPHQDHSHWDRLDDLLLVFPNLRWFSLWLPSTDRELLLELSYLYVLYTY